MRKKHRETSRNSGSDLDTTGKYLNKYLSETGALEKAVVDLVAAKSGASIGRSNGQFKVGSHCPINKRLVWLIGNKLMIIISKCILVGEKTKLVRFTSKLTFVQEWWISQLSEHIFLRSRDRFLAVFFVSSFVHLASTQFILRCCSL